MLMKSLKNWLNKVFCQNDTPDTSEASLNTSGEVINNSDTDGIGEPILSFIETYRNNPERFTRVSGGRLYGELIDTFTDTGFTLFTHPHKGIELSSWKCGTFTQLEKVTCFSQKQLEYLFETLIYPEVLRYDKIIKRKNRMYTSRQKRLQREQLMEVYCNEI